MKSQFPSQASFGEQISIKLVAIAKDEGPYLAEWIFHHLNIGINEIEVWLNNTSDNSSEILKYVSCADNRVKFVEADSLYMACTESKRNFQLSVYTIAYESARSAGANTHMLFLDLDEYLLCRDLNASIHELIREKNGFDIMSFLWYVDEPTSASPFGGVVHESQTIYRNTHVKSMASLSCDIRLKPLHHNFAATGNRPVMNILPSGTELNNFNTLLNRQRIKPGRIALDPSHIESWFIYHKVFKSRVEYCVSLLRGRGHNNIKLPLKDNRRGYLSKPGSRGVSLRFSADSISQYKARLSKFLCIKKLRPLTERAREIHLDKYQSFKTLLTENPSLRQEFNTVLRGTGHESNNTVLTPTRLESQPTNLMTAMPRSVSRITPPPPSPQTLSNLPRSQ